MSPDDEPDWARDSRNFEETLFDRVSRRLAQAKLDELNHWRLKLGAQLDELLVSRGSTERCISDTNPVVREAALSLIDFHWGPELSKTSEYLDILRSDPDVQVRIAAMLCLVDSCQGSQNREVGVVLAKIIKDASNPVKLRHAAYMALCEIQRFPLGRDTLFEMVKSEDAYLIDLDWSFVESFLSDSGGRTFTEDE